MPKTEVKALLSLREEICSDLIVNYVIDFLVKSQIYSTQEKEEIGISGQKIGSVNSVLFREKVLKEQTETFLNLLIKKVEKSSNAFDKFMIVLMKDDNYPWIAKRLEQTIEDLTKDNSIKFNSNKEKKLSKAHDVPNKVRHLLERQDKVDTIRTALEEVADNGYGWVVLYGMGGSGKTILASEAVRDWMTDYYSDGIWWTNCGLLKKDNKFDNSLLLLKMQFLWDRFCEHSVSKHQKFEWIESAANKLKHFLNSHPKSLLVLDDVWDKEVLENFELGVPVLFTTRDKSIIPPKFDCVKYINTIDDNDYGLSIEESRELLALWVKADPNDIKNESVNRIIEKFKGNPLCLTLIGSVMEEKENNPRLWHFYLESIDIPESRSPRRKSSSGTKNYFIYDNLGFNSLVKRSYEALDSQMREHFKYFSLFIDDIRIPTKVFQTVWLMNEFEVDHILDRLVHKSLVIKNKSNNVTLYMVHDIILNFLKIKCVTDIELQTLHEELLDRYFDNCKSETGQIDYSLLPNDGYIYYFLGYHIYKSNRHHLFADIFLDLSFVVNKIRYTGPSDLLNDYFHYKIHFKDFKKEYEDYVHFVSTNADLLCDVNIDVIQLTLCQPIESQVYKNGLALIQTTRKDKLYLKWLNQSNVKTSKLLSTKLHSGPVRYAVFSPNKSIVVSVGSDKIIRVWDSNTGKQLKTMKGHENTINCCQFNSNGSILITASDDGTVKIWEMDFDSLFSNEMLTSPRPRSGSQYPYICNGNAAYDDSTHTYNEHLNGNQTDDQIEVKCCAFSPNNRLIVSGGSDLIPRVWTVDDLDTKYILEGHKHTVQSCQFSNDSKLIITSSGDEVIVWCTSKAQILQTLSHEMVVGNCVFSGNLNYIYTSSGRYVYKWSSNGKNKPLCTYNNLKTKYYVTYCTVSPNGKYIAAGTTTDQIIIWPSDSLTRVAVATFKGTDRITCINFNNDSTQLLSCSEDGTIIIWDTSKTFGASMVALRKKFWVQNHNSTIKVLTPDENGTIRLFEGFEGKENKALALRPNPNINSQICPTYDITCCALSATFDVLFGTSDGDLILYYTSAQNETYFLPKHDKEISFCAFINGLNKFVSASKDSTFRIFNKFSRNYENPFNEILENGISSLNPLIMGPIVNCKIFSKESKVLIWCEDGSLLVINLRKNRLIARCSVEDNSQINYADVTKSEELIATVSSDKSVILWRSHIKALEKESNDLNIIFSIRVIKTDNCPRSCRFAPNANYLAIGDDSGKIKIWNFHGSDSNTLQVFKDCHSDWVNDISISPKGNLIITISKSIKLWNKDGHLLQTFKTNGGSMNSIYTHFKDHQNSKSQLFDTIVTVDDAGVLYILQLINFDE